MYKTIAIVLVAVVALLSAAACGTTTSTTNPEKTTAAATTAAAAVSATPTASATPVVSWTDKVRPAVLKEMRINFGKDVTAVKVEGSPETVQIQVYTTYNADPDVAGIAKGMAMFAAQSSPVLWKYPSTTIEAYVWPKGKEFYMTRATASYTDGKLDSPIHTFVNDVLQ